MSLISIGSMCLLFYLFYSSFNQALYDAKKTQSRSLNEAAYGAVASFYHQVQDGQIDESSAKAMALHALRNAIYDGNGYFWVNDSHGIMIMHPATPENETLDVKNWTDANGKYAFKEFIRMATEGGGWVSYLWFKPGNNNEYFEKISYVSHFEPWDWIIGTGIYLDDVQKEAEKLFYNSLKIIIPSFLFLVFFSVMIARHFSRAIESLAIRDPLTNLYTRRYLNETEDQFVRIDKRNAANHLYIVFLDIDHFKKINDSYGHLTGDDVLRTVGNILRQQSRPADLCVRYGGEEFVILMLEEERGNVVKFTERLRGTINEQLFKPGFNITVSAGIATRKPNEIFTDALNRADQNLYRAKESGRDCYCTDFD